MKWLLVLKEWLKDILGESKGCEKPTKETWWWNTELQATIKLKREAKRKAKCWAYDKSYNKLGMKEGEKHIC